jgi:nucleoside-diphosphate kinase
LGCTNSLEAPAGTIRGDFGLDTRENIAHASDSPENAQIEINRFFATDEIFDV